MWQMNEKTYVLSKEGKDIKIIGRKKVIELLKINQTKLNQHIKEQTPVDGFLISVFKSKEQQEVKERNKFIEKQLEMDPNLDRLELCETLQKMYPGTKSTTLRNAIYNILRKQNKKNIKNGSLRHQLEKIEEARRKKQDEDNRPLEKMEHAGSYGFYWRVNSKRCG